MQHSKRTSSRHTEAARASSPCLGSWMQPKKHGMEARATSEPVPALFLSIRHFKLDML